jgi:hypothetical protein
MAEMMYCAVVIHPLYRKQKAETTMKPQRTSSAQKTTKPNRLFFVNFVRFVLFVVNL